MGSGKFGKKKKYSRIKQKRKSNIKIYRKTNFTSTDMHLLLEKLERQLDLNQQQQFMDI